MLDIIRTKKNGFLTLLVVLALAFIFAVNFGPGSLSRSNGCGGGTTLSQVASVNGTAISATEFERQYERRLQLLQSQLGGAFTREIAQQLGVANIALDDVVHRELLAQEAQRRGIAVTDQEISNVVQQSPEFQQDGRFSFDAYRRSVARDYGSTGRFEDLLRRDLLASKMQTLILSTVKVSDAEVKAAWQAEANRVDLTYVKFPTAGAERDVKLSDADVKAFQDANESRIDAYYDQNKARFDQPARVHVRHILARATNDAQSDAAKKKIEAAAQRVSQGEDFAKVASEVSEDQNTKAHGGDLGFVTENLVEKPFAEAAFSLKAGEVSKPVKDSTGWHLVQAVEVVPAKKTSKEDARPEIARELLAKERAQGLARERAQAALAAVQGGKSLADLFPAEGAKKVTFGGEAVTVQDTGPFGAASVDVPNLGAAPALVADAVAAKSGAVLPKVYDVPGGEVIAVVKTRELPDDSKYEAQRGTVEQRLRNRKETQVFGALLEQLKKDAKVEVNDAYFARLSPQQPAQGS